MIRSGFIFQINPLCFHFRFFVVYIIKGSHRKDNKSLIDMLSEIKSILHNYRVEIVAISFDGDNSYTNMNQLFNTNLLI